MSSTTFLDPTKPLSVLRLLLLLAAHSVRAEGQIATSMPTLWCLQGFGAPPGPNRSENDDGRERHSEHLI